jgi:secreted PhoX family phosphatase
MMKSTNKWSRREFLRFFGGSMYAGYALSFPLNGLANQPLQKIRSLSPTDADQLILADGLRHEMLISWGDVINEQGDKFGFNNDFIAHVAVADDPNDRLLWVNHEYVTTGYFLTPADPQQKSLADVQMEQKEVGGSILRIKKFNNKWQFVQNDAYNRRIDAATQIPIVSNKMIMGRRNALGTISNCAGGTTPWKSFLSCEENYDDVVGEVDYVDGKRTLINSSISGWEQYLDMPPEHYGWVVEVNPYTGEAKKHTSMGRFAHESATVVEAADGRCVVYSGDDKADECIYKFIADRPGSLETGTLYVADTINGKWLPLHIRLQPELAKTFGSQLDVMIQTRKAAHMIGGTPQDRPEDIKQDPRSGAIYVALTKHSTQTRPFGSILKIEEKENDPLALEFVASTFLTGGDDSGFACPDNLAFDPRGNLWFTSDISGADINKPPYASFKNNGLFFVPMTGESAGIVHQLASAPVHAELTGPSFSPDGRELFLAVQHPGEYSQDRNNLDSHWPDGGNAMPRPSVVVISGEFLDNYSSKV